jgi:hypothetical protein
LLRTIPALALALLLATVLPAHADDEPLTVEEIIVQAADGYGVDANAMLRVAWCESLWNPRAVGDHGSSLGIFQLHRPGMRGVFESWGYTNAFDAEQSADFVARWIALTGNWRPWTCARKLGVR